MKAPLVNARGLRHRYGAATQTLVFPDFTLAAGHSLLLLGASGSGKSTLLALLCGLLRLQEGELEVAGLRLHAPGKASLDLWRGQHIGFVPQRLHLAARLSVRDNLALPYVASAQAVDDARIRALMALLGLQGLDQRRPHELSGGQAQRVALARALLRRPALLLADEPTASLDDDHAQAAIQLLQEATQAEGVSLLVASHDARVREAWPLAQRLLLSAQRAGGGGEMARQIERDTEREVERDVERSASAVGSHEAATPNAAERVRD
jgi:putative ABC transport system ATP-binding protein